MRGSGRGERGERLSVRGAKLGGGAEGGDWGGGQGCWGGGGAGGGAEVGDC